MAFKKRIWIFGLIGAIFSLLGSFSPFLAILPTNPFISGYVEWLWGLQITTSTSFSVVPILLTMAILLIVFTIVALIFSFIARKRKKLTIMGILWLISGIGTLVVIFLPIGYYRNLGASFEELSRALFTGFYFPVIGGILETNAGIIGLALR